MNSDLRLTKLLSSALGLGVVALLEDKQISEVRLSSDGSIWANRLGVGKYQTEVRVDQESARRAIYAVAFGVADVCNSEHPFLSAEIPGSGERFQGILPPLSQAPLFVIRKKASKIFSLSDLEDQGVLSRSTSELVRAAALRRRNILIVGGTDSGKTTFANAILKVIQETNDRMIILEDTQELQCEARDVEYLHTKDGVASLRDLVRCTMRMSPDRIVIGEVRGAEALDLLKAWNTGHPGGLSTVHANSAEKGLLRIEQLVQEAGVVPCRAMIAEAINLLIYTDKVGTMRLVRDVLEVRGVKGNGEYDPCSFVEDNS